MEISGNIVDIHQRKIFHGVITVKDGIITSVKEKKGDSSNYILPGLIDAHIHIESSMLTPSAFARLAVVHGTVATVSDPHEIANVLGIKGVEYMIANGNSVPFKFYFGAPSCVPATGFETSGATLNEAEIDYLLQKPEIKYLAEMMNFPGVIYDDTAVHVKLRCAKKHDKPIDGHAPGLRGDDLKKYVKAGISTDHECMTIEEARDKLGLGMKILIREGSAAKNFDTLLPLLKTNKDDIMFCSDDKHPDDLIEGHINQLVQRALRAGYDIFDILQVTCTNPVEHYNLETGLLRAGDAADFIVVDDLKKFNVLATYINGKKVAEEGKPLFPSVSVTKPNAFKAKRKKRSDFQVPATKEHLQVIEVIDGELFTKTYHAMPKIFENKIVPDLDEDILKITVINRYQNTKPAVAFIKNFGFKQGAIASSVAHDSHNIIAVGTSDELLTKAVNLVIKHKGGIVATDGKSTKVLPLPIAGLMTDDDGVKTGNQYKDMNYFVRQNLGSPLRAPFMTLSFMALLVIPEIKLSDKGLFNGTKFELI